MQREDNMGNVRVKVLISLIRLLNDASGLNRRNIIHHPAMYPAEAHWFSV